MEQKELAIITGSTGFIGAALVDKLAERYEVIGLDQVEPRRSSPAEFISIDLTSQESVRVAFERVR